MADWKLNSHKLAGEAAGLTADQFYNLNAIEQRKVLDGTYKADIGLKPDRPELEMGQKKALEAASKGVKNSVPTAEKQAANKKTNLETVKEATPLDTVLTTVGAKDRPTDTKKVGAVAKTGDEAPAAAGNKADARFDNMIAMAKDRYNSVDDYYKNSLSGTFDELGEKDKRLLLLDTIGNFLENQGQRRSYMGSAFAAPQEERGPGNKESLARKMLNENVAKGLERRNNRLESQMNEQLKIADFPADLEMALRSQWEALKNNTRGKAYFINLMKDVSFIDAIKASMINDPQGTLGNVANIAKSFKGV